MSKVKNKSEIRLYCNDLTVQHRSGQNTEEKPRTIRGYFCVFNKNSDPIYGLFIERIDPKALEGIGLEDMDIVCLFNHDYNILFGRTGNKTLRVGYDEKGGWFECDVAETTQGDDLLVHIQRGDVSACSFGFYIKEQKWIENEGDQLDERIILKFKKITDVSPVTTPAYRDTEISMRSNSVDQYEEWKKAVAEKRSNQNEDGEASTSYLDAELQLMKYKN